MGEIYAKIFLAIHIPFFQKLTYRSDPSADLKTAKITKGDIIQQHIDTQSV